MAYIGAVPRWYPTTFPKTDFPKEQIRMTSINRTWRQARLWLLAGLSVGVLAACGGSDDGPKYSRLVVFGDSLSDVGTYATAGVKAIGGGKYTVNGANNKIWVERLAERAGVAAPCAAQTGLESSGPLAGLAQTPTNVSGCYGYAQGGSRVTNPIGPANKALLQLGNQDGALGQLTVPLVAQMDRHLSVAGNRIAGDELVLVFAGGNDVFMNLATFNATVAGGGDATTAATAAVTAMGTAGAELATMVRTKLVANGAARVVVINAPDMTKTPFGISLGATAAPLLTQMVTTYNSQLAAGLSGVTGVLAIDGYQLSQFVASSPVSYGLANVTTPVCSAAAQLGSLSCSAATLIPSVDISLYQYADGVHPTPAGHRVIADSVINRMVAAGWL